MTQFEKKFKKWGIVTVGLKETWEQNCLVMNNVIDKKDKALRYIVSAPTGSAKTENVITYCSMLPSRVKVVICTNLVTEVDRLASDINQESGNTRACAFHTKNTNIIFDQAVTYQIVVVTHEFYRRNFAGSTRWQELIHDRDLVIIDEALNTMTELNVKSSSITKAITVFSHLSNQVKYTSNSYFNRALEHLNNDLAFLINYPQSIGAGTNLTSSDRIWSVPLVSDPTKKANCLSITVPKYDLFLDILRKDKSIEYNKILTGINDSSKDCFIKDDIAMTLDNLNGFSERQVYVTASDGEYHYNRVIDSTPKQSLVCFDATAGVNAVYRIRSEHHGDIISIPTITNVRNYSTVTLHTAETPTGKMTINKTTAVGILQNIAFGKKTLIITHKQNKAYFEETLSSLFPNYITYVIHWGALTGLNKWQDFDTCVIIGLNNKPRSFSQNRVLINTNEAIAFGENQNSLNKVVADTDLVSEIIQAMNRIRIRKVATSSGGCDSANIYLTLPYGKKAAYEHHIKTQMTDIKIVPWVLPKSISIERTKGHIDNVIGYLDGNLRKNDSLEVNSVRDALYIEPESFRSLLGKSQSKKKEFLDTLAICGFFIIEKKENDSRGRERKKPTLYFSRK